MISINAGRKLQNMNDDRDDAAPPSYAGASASQYHSNLAIGLALVMGVGEGVI